MKSLGLTQRLHVSWLLAAAGVGTNHDMAALGGVVWRDQQCGADRECAHSAIGAAGDAADICGWRVHRCAGGGRAHRRADNVAAPVYGRRRHVAGGAGLGAAGGELELAVGNHRLPCHYRGDVVDAATDRAAAA